MLSHKTLSHTLFLPLSSRDVTPPPNLISLPLSKTHTLISPSHLQAKETEELRTGTDETEKEEKGRVARMVRLELVAATVAAGHLGSGAAVAREVIGWLIGLCWFRSKMEREIERVMER